MGSRKTAHTARLFGTTLFITYSVTKKLGLSQVYSCHDSLGSGSVCPVFPSWNRASRGGSADAMNWFAAEFNGNLVVLTCETLSDGWW